MPPKCAVVGCGASKSQNRPNLSFHKLPRNEAKKRIWLESIGNENLISHTKEIFICSLHFEESSFNRTLDVVRLRDDAVPSLYKQQLSTLAESPALTPIELNEPLGSQQNPILNQTLKEKQALQEKVAGQKRKIKCLNETVRRQKIKIESSKAIIKELKEKNLLSNDNAIVLEQCAGPKDFLRRQISKAKGLALERQYTEEVRKFALTLHIISPKAFVRTTYNSCLPIPRTL